MDLKGLLGSKISKNLETPWGTNSVGRFLAFFQGQTVRWICGWYRGIPLCVLAPSKKYPRLKKGGMMAYETPTGKYIWSELKTLPVKWHWDKTFVEIRQIYANPCRFQSLTPPFQPNQGLFLKNNVPAVIIGSPLWPPEALGESPAEVLAAHQLLEFDEKATSLPRARHENRPPRIERCRAVVVVHGVL